MALTNKLSAIGDAIREKTGKTDLLTLDQMPTEISSITTGGGSVELPEEALVIDGECVYKFSYNNWNWFINEYGDKITTSNLYKTNGMFYNSTELNQIPFVLNYTNSVDANLEEMFYSTKITTPPTMLNVRPENIGDLFSQCYYLVEIPEGFSSTWDFSTLNGNSYGNKDSIFYQCYSLRKVPYEFLKNLYGGSSSTGYSYHVYYGMFNCCYSIDAIDGIGVEQGTVTSNMFNYMFYKCMRVNSITFDRNEDGTPKTANWKNQTIDLSQYVGYADYASTLTAHGFTQNYCINTDEKYDELISDENSFTNMPEYSRYNIDSAYATIDSLPDTSTYLATAGGTNTIKFKGSQGSYGTALENMDTETIAIASAKGWTVSFV